MLIQVKGVLGQTMRMWSAGGYPLNDGQGDSNASLMVTPANPQVVQRGHIFVAAQAGVNALVQCAATSTPFSKAYFYGIKSASTAGTSLYTPNVGTVYVGENDPQGDIYTIDDVPSGGQSALVDLPPPGEAYDLVNFWVLIPTIGDRLLIKYVL